MEFMLCLWCSVCCVLFFFFFSSRRRHTRYWRDWSSDVCSSDLVVDGERQGLYGLPWVKVSDGRRGRRNAQTLCGEDRKSTRLNSSHANISYAVFCLKKKKDEIQTKVGGSKQNVEGRSPEYRM